MPVNAVGIVSLLSYALTFVKGNALENGLKSSKHYCFLYFYKC